MRQSVPFYKKLILSVTVRICDICVIRHILIIRCQLVIMVRLRFLERYFHILVRPRRHRIARLIYLAADHCLHAVLRFRGALCIQIIRILIRADLFDHFTVSEDPIGSSLGIFIARDAEAYKHSF